MKERLKERLNISKRDENVYWLALITRREWITAGIKGSLYSAGIVYLFYHSWLLLFPGSIVGIIFYLKQWQRRSVMRKQQQFKEQFKEAMRSISGALKVGYSLENAIGEAQKELQMLYKKEPYILEEFSYMQRQLNLHISAEQSFYELARRTHLEEIRQFSDVLMIGKRSGGNLIEIVRESIRQMAEKADTEKEIEALLAAKRMEFQIMTVVPLGMITYLCMGFPDFVEVLYETVAGRIVMTVCLIFYVGAYRMGRSMVDIEV